MPQNLILRPDAEDTSPGEPASGIVVFRVIRERHIKGQQRIRVAYLIGDRHIDVLLAAVINSLDTFKRYRLHCNSLWVFLVIKEVNRDGIVPLKGIRNRMILECEAGFVLAVPLDEVQNLADITVFFISQVVVWKFWIEYGGKEEGSYKICQSPLKATLLMVAFPSNSTAQ